MSSMQMVLNTLCDFLQAEDGIRDTSVTGVQTCALPISDLEEVLVFEKGTGVGRIRNEGRLVGQLRRIRPDLAVQMGNGDRGAILGVPDPGRLRSARFWLPGAAPSPHSHRAPGLGKACGGEQPGPGAGLGRR